MGGMTTKKRGSKKPGLSKQQRAYLDYAKHNVQVDGEVEFDDDAKVSISQDGAYVQGWIYIDSSAIED